ncbi:MAG: von Willebrand factor type A domain-containing protein [Crocinitomicaceae bacterium]|nr:von Willebrand factor type A domain-containing protein [Crocinitomicaceae bacterium]
MKYTCLVFGFLFSIQSFAQTGSLAVRCLNEQTGNSVQTLVEIKKDTIILAAESTDKHGRVRFSGLPVGMVELQIALSDGTVDLRQAFIQDGQLFQVVIEVEQGSLVNNEEESNDFVIGNQGEEIVITEDVVLSESRGLASVTRVPNVGSVNDISVLAGVQQINEMSVSSSTRANRLSGGMIALNLLTISRSDIQSLPMRSVNSIAGTVGGVYQNELSQDLYIRGSRADASAYYLDGVRVTDMYGIPKSTINSVTVYAGGVPANYGDLTGGVIAVETRSYDAPMGVYDSRAVANSYDDTPAYVPRPSLNLDRFASIYENDFQSTVVHPNSTFGVDVDRASWTYVKKRFSERALISRDAVRMEEMINAFKYKKIEVPENELMQIEIERSTCAWNEESQLVTIHLQARDMPSNAPRMSHNFVFLVDVSGSMGSSNKLELVKKGLISFVKTLEPTDRVAIVTYSGRVEILLGSILCEDKDSIIGRIDALYAEGGTDGAGGIQTAYAVAAENYDPELNNRIILCTDGDFNIGISNTGDLEKYIAQKRGSGIYLTALGFGMGNLRDDILESLADRGDGNHFYIGDMKECKRVLVDEVGNLINIARDVKLNVEFNPNLVTEYRLIGYENRMLKPKDFEDDTKDAGEIGYNHSVTAVYEIKLGDADRERTHFTRTRVTAGDGELAYVRLRYKSFEDTSSVERNFTLREDQEVLEGELVNLVASFGLLLRDSMFKGEMTAIKLKKIAKSFDPIGEDEEELKAMILSL